MTLKSKATTARKTFMNPLFLIVLSIIACTSVISALSTHGEVERDPDTLDAASNGVINVRNGVINVRDLRHDAKTSDDSMDFEDRTISDIVVEGVPTSMRFGIAKWFHGLQLRRWKKPPYTAFRTLNLHREQGKMFESPAFAAWVSFVRSEYPTTASEEIIPTLLGDRSYIEFATLVLDALKIPRQSAMALGAYEDLLSFWIHKEFTPGTVYELLTPEQKGTAILQGDLELLWLDFVRRHKEVTLGKQNAPND